MTETIKEIITNELHFHGKNKYWMDQTIEEAEFLAHLDKVINRAIKRTEEETGAPVEITEGDRYLLRWELIKEILIARGMNPATLEEMQSAVTEATDTAIKERRAFVDQFKLVKSEEGKA